MQKKADPWSLDHLEDPGWQTTPTNHPCYLWPLGLRRFAQTFSNIDFFIIILLQLSNKLIVFRVMY